MYKWSEAIILELYQQFPEGDEESHGELRIVGFIVDIQNRDL
jgi:hypothetical protein